MMFKSRASRRIMESDVNIEPGSLKLDCKVAEMKKGGEGQGTEIRHSYGDSHDSKPISEVSLLDFTCRSKKN